MEGLREVKISSRYLLVCFLYACGFKGSSTYEHQVQDDSGTPNVHLIGVPANTHA